MKFLLIRWLQDLLLNQIGHLLLYIFAFLVTVIVTKLYPECPCYRQMLFSIAAIDLIPELGSMLWYCIKALSTPIETVEGWYALKTLL